MLAAIENRLAALIGDGLATRPHTRVVRTPVAAPDPGKGTVLVTVAALEPAATFEPALFSAGAGNAQTAPVRRVTALRLHARVDVVVSAAAADAVSAGRARDLVLDDAATIVHLLDRAEVRAGTAFTPDDPDPGFQVHEFGLEKAAVEGTPPTAQLVFVGRADVWPVDAATDEGRIGDIDRIVTPLPLTISVDRQALAPGGSTPVRVHSFAPTRLTAPNGARGPASLAISVLSDVPPAQRGAVLEGVAGPETGLRIVPVASPATVFTYQAPAANPGAPRWEYIQIHLATAGGERGGLLGTAAVRIASAA